MDISINEQRFEEHQKELLLYLAKTIRSVLIEKGVDEDSLYDITGDLLFSICATIDSAALVGSASNPVLPVLTFSKSLDRKNDLFASASGSTMHEKAFSCVDELFK